MRFEVVHRVPGRVRLRIAELRRGNGTEASLSRTLAHDPDVSEFRLNAFCSSVVICYDPAYPDALTRIEAVLRAADWREVETVAQPPAPHSGWTGVIRRVLAGPARPFLWASACLSICLTPFPALTAATLPVLVYTALPGIRRAFHVLRHERRLNVDFLDSVALIVSLGRGQFFTGAFITWMISLGDFIRERTAAKSKRAITDLLAFQTANAWVLVGSKVVRKPVDQVNVGDEVVVYPGEIIPVDGEILRGAATVDQKTVTGESLPVERSAGHTAYAATVVREGKIVVRATRVKADTTAARIVHLIEAAPVGETRIQNYAEKFADRLVAPMLLFGGGLYAMTGDLNRLLSMTIVDYGTGIRVAAPTTVLAAMTHAARQGILIKSGSHMEKLATLDTVIFDKTGTLTRGVPQILDIVSYNERHFPSRAILRLAAAAEARLKHPVAEAIVRRAKTDRIRVPERIGAEFQIGMGVEARVNGYFIHIGNERFFEKKKIAFAKSSGMVAALNAGGSSTLLFAVDGTLAGLIPYADQVRAESRDVIRTLRNRGVKHTVMLTGDNGVVAGAVAARLGIEKFYADTLPADKAEIVRQYQRRGGVVAMVGDGINDSPALAYADVGIAMKEAAEVARESADVVLMEDNLWKLAMAVDIAKDAMGLMRQNYGIIATLNTVALALAIPPGLVTPNFSALLSNGSAILASLNAMRPILDY